MHKYCGHQLLLVCMLVDTYAKTNQLVCTVSSNNKIGSVSIEFFFFLLCTEKSERRNLKKKSSKFHLKIQSRRVNNTGRLGKRKHRLIFFGLTTEMLVLVSWHYLLPITCYTFLAISSLIISVDKDSLSNTSSRSRVSTSLQLHLC